MTKPNKVLITGAAGFIGSHLADALLARGLTVVGIDSLKLGKRENLATAFAHPRFKFFQANLNDLATTGGILAEETKAAPSTSPTRGREFSPLFV